jgi:hypothetical protein
MIGTIFEITIICLFLLFFIYVLLSRKITIDILDRTKEIDHDKWLYLISFQNSLINKFKRILWVNPLRFERFIKSDSFLNDIKLEYLKSRYKKSKRYTFFCFSLICVIDVVLLFSMLL